RFIISERNTKINYLLSDTSDDGAVKKSTFKNIKVTDPDFGFVIDENDFVNISKMIKNIPVENVRITLDGNNAILYFYKEDFSNSFEIAIKMDVAPEEKKVYEL